MSKRLLSHGSVTLTERRFLASFFFPQVNLCWYLSHLQYPKEGGRGRGDEGRGCREEMREGGRGRGDEGRGCREEIERRGCREERG